MEGFEKTTAALTVLINAANKVDAALSDDGKISLTEGIGIAMTGIGLVSLFKNLGEIAGEIKNITPDSLSALVELFKTKFDLKNDEAELMVEQSLEVLARLIVVVFAKKALTIAPAA